MANKKMTKRDYFNELLNISEVKENKSMVDFINHELELLEKKNASKSSKPTKNQESNELLKQSILAEMVEGERYTITEMIAKLPCCEGLTNQKVLALVRQLKDSGEVVRTEEKGKAYYSLA